MAFDAGSIKGTLDLDTTSFSSKFDEAHTHAQTHAGAIREILESLVTVFEEALGPAVGAFGQQLQSVFAGFSEGPIVGTLAAIATAAGSVREAVGEVGDQFHTLALEAQKAGVSVEFMDRWANVASTANVGIEQLGTGFKILEEKAQLAADAGKGLDKVGISAKELTQLLKDPQALFDRVQQSIGGMTSATERQLAARDLLGRQGAAFIPIFAMPKEQFDSTAAAMDRLSGGVTESSVKMGADFALLKAYAEKAFEGIERAVATPVLGWLANHVQEIEPLIERGTSQIVGFIKDVYVKGAAVAQPVFAYLEQHAGQIKAGVENITGEIVTFVELMYQRAAELARPILQYLSDHAEQIKNAVGVATTDTVQFVEQMYEKAKAAAKPVLQYLADHAEAIKSQVESAMNKIQSVIKEAYDAALGSGGGLRLELQLIEWGFSKLKAEILSLSSEANSKLKAEWDELAHGPLKPALDDLLFVFDKIGKSIEFASAKAAELRGYLEKVAGIDGTGFNSDGPGFRTAGTKSADQARQELKDAGFPVDAPQQKTPEAKSVASQPRPAPATTSSADTVSSLPHAPAAAPPTVKSGGGIEHSPADHSIGDYRRSHPQRSEPDSVSQRDRQQVTLPQFSDDSISDYRRSHPQRLEQDSISQRDRQRVTVPQFSDDSISEYRRAHPQRSEQDSIAQRNGEAQTLPMDAMKDSLAGLSQSIRDLNSHFRESAGLADNRTTATPGPTTNHYAINMVNHVDANKTASVLAAMLLPQIQKIQKQHDQKAAGALAANNVAKSLGGQ